MAHYPREKYKEDKQYSLRQPPYIIPQAQKHHNILANKSYLIKQNTCETKCMTR